MLSYQHAFHAGNHADILKHYVLTFVLLSLCKKDKAFTFFDTHSASGLFDLLDNRSLKTGEAQKGVEAFVNHCKENNLSQNFGQAFKSYFDLISSYLDKNLYPGSPLIEKSFIRPQDKLILSELHPQEIENLRKNISGPNIQIFHKDGFENLKALTPPLSKRGGVLIDPSYEEASDYEKVSKTVCQVHKKWSNGIILIWYPLLSHREEEIKAMLDTIISQAKKINENVNISNLTLCVNSKDSHKEEDLKVILADQDKKNPPRLYGSGMLVLNSPWHLDEEGKIFCDYASTFFQRKN
ncbi:MAG: 23S rRNA (adenine(2030)-N(6))-methyltransferase RlmJ [Treponema sp.]|nr:23S rRNA (adenine(2030)-N(6))-methyltransferase RlmJ [Treponema sp.]